jgi:hypothetical protein
MATLINVATPGPALNLSKTAQAYAASTLYGETPVTEEVANTVYQLDSISIIAGTWVVIGVTSVLYAIQTNYLNLVSATGSNSWPVQVTANSTSTNMAIAAVIKVTATTTIYLNGKNTDGAQAAGAAMFAVQIA